jgi:hypothetical protein
LPIEQAGTASDNISLHHLNINGLLGKQRDEKTEQQSHNSLSIEHRAPNTHVQVGGVGVLHYNCSTAEQAEMVAAVKRYRPGHIPQPWVLPPDAKIEEFLTMAVRCRLSVSHDLLSFHCFFC